jgi:long-chain acyl-CoA synthetase
MPEGHEVFNSAYDELRAICNRHPSKLAIRFENEEITYESLLSLVDNAAENMRELGIGISNVFAAFSQNRPDILFCYYAASKLGAIFVPLNPNLTSVEIQFALDHSGASVLFYDEQTHVETWQDRNSTKVVPISSLRKVQKEKANPPPSTLDPASNFLIIYTSGSTGDPKAIVLDHSAQVNAVAALSRMWGIGQNDTTLVGLPLGYLYGLSTAAAVGLQRGGTVVIMRRFHPRDVLDEMLKSRATVYHGVPTMYFMMLEYCEQRELRYDLSGMRELICAGAPLPGEMRLRFSERFGKALHDYYAMTECTPIFGKYFDDPNPLPAQAIGRLAPGAIVRILRPDGSDCTDDEEGEILARSAATMKYYLKNPDLTATTMSEGFIRTGDLGFRDIEGNYFISGRIKDVIIRGGANISPAEVERVLLIYPGVQDVAVVGALDKIFGEVPVAFIVRRHGFVVSEADLIQHAEKLLSDFKVPRRFVFATHLPQGKTGKVDKAQLKRSLVGSHEAKDG